MKKLLLFVLCAVSSCGAYTVNWNGRSLLKGDNRSGLLKELQDNKDKITVVDIRNTNFGSLSRRYRCAFVKCLSNLPFLSMLFSKADTWK